ELFSRRLVAVLAGEAAAEEFAEALVPLLSEHTLPAERELIAQTRHVLSVTRALGEREQAALRRCVQVMSEGMSQCQRTANLAGLADIPELDQYCYYVAGVVGEMLTELFCAYSPEIAARHAELMDLAPSFGQGLQMTNILKDLNADRARGVCWLPRSLYAGSASGGSDLLGEASTATHEAAMAQLVALAHAHLRNALRYTLLIPARERGIRRFCLWAVGLALLTLRNIHRRPGFRDAAEIKVSRRTVAVVALLGRLSARSDGLAQAFFALAARGLPPPAERPSWVRGHTAP
ncbi:MAG: squalene/phytoene synthase family protein, partial [Gammaproteobacteria bacterium]|nr:squalene/phytoene synthase family protein [Gammaproteobacteria bacterium]